MIDFFDKYDAVEWQSFSQKKDIEAIVKNTKEKKDIQLTATVEICLVTLSIAADNIWENGSTIVWAIIVALSILPIAALIFKYICVYIKKHRPGSDIPNSKDMIDIFDNEVCYYIMMAKSYSKKIKKCPENEDVFFYIEMCFYLNKAIHYLSCMENCANAVFSEKYEEIYSSKKISVTRLKNLYNIIDEVYHVINAKKGIIEKIDLNNNFVELIDRYQQTYEGFKERIKRVFDDID